MQKRRVKAVELVLSVVLLSVVALPTASAGLSAAPDLGGLATGTDVVASIKTVINGLLGVVAIVAVIFVIIGGLRYIFSSGDEDTAGKAKMTILYALIGLVVIGLAVVLVNFVIGAF